MANPRNMRAVPDQRIDYLAAISEHTVGMAQAAAGNLERPVPGCPGWTVRELVSHLIDVQWFWKTIVEQRLQQPPEETARPPKAEAALLLDQLRRGGDRLVLALKSADETEVVWTWAPGRSDVGFITRHQAQEAAVHHWDACEARGEHLTAAPELAADAVDEFLAVSISSDADPADPPRPPLGGSLILACSDAPQAWTLSDGLHPGTVAVQAGVKGKFPVLRATAWELLLWLYRRGELDLGEVPTGLADRLRALCFTD